MYNKEGEIASPALGPFSSPSATMEMEKLLDGYEICARAEGKSEKTIASMRTAVRLFASFLRSQGLPTDVTQIGTAEPRAFINHLRTVNKYQDHPFSRPQDKNLSPFTINGYVRAIRAFWSWMLAEEFIEKNPLARVRAPKVPQRLMPTLGEKEQQAVIGSIDRSTSIGFRDYAMVLMMIDSGVRVGELVGLAIDDIDFEQGMARVLGKGSKERLVPFGAVVAKALWKYLYRYRGEPETPPCRSFFLTREGRPMTVNRVEKRMAEYREQAGIEERRCTPHVLRHTFATRYLELGGDPLTLRRILGHTRLEMTRQYVHQSDTKIKAAHRLYSPVDNMRLPRTGRRR